jgi:hypothetical protein
MSEAAAPSAECPHCGFPTTVLLLATLHIRCPRCLEDQPSSGEELGARTTTEVWAHWSVDDLI